MSAGLSCVIKNERPAAPGLGVPTLRRSRPNAVRAKSRGEYAATPKLVKGWGEPQPFRRDPRPIRAPWPEAVARGPVERLQELGRGGVPLLDFVVEGARQHLLELAAHVVAQVVESGQLVGGLAGQNLFRRLPRERRVSQERE